MRPSADCEVWLDGERAPCHPDDLAAGIPTVLTDLTINWGRRTQLEQPDIATCGLKIRDESASQDALTIAHVGATVQVFATGYSPNPISGETIFKDAGFEDTPAGKAYPSDRFVGTTTPYVTSAYHHSGQQSLRISGSGNPASRSFLLSPLPFSAAPNAWDSIPQLAPNETWPVSLWVRAPQGATFSIMGAITSTPIKGQEHKPWVQLVTATGYGSWVQVQTTITNSTANPGWPLIGIDAQLPAATQWQDATGIWTDHPETWTDLQWAVIDDLVVTGPPTVIRRVLVFAGKVTDVVCSPVSDDVIELELTAADIGVDLENDAIGDDPWPVQNVQVRADRITSLAHLNIPVVIDGSLQSTLVSYRDVDAQPVLALLQDLADSVAATLWTATHGTGGSYFWMEDPDQRIAVKQLGLADTRTLSATNFAINPISIAGGSLGWWVPSRITLSAGVGYIRGTINDANPVGLAQRFNTPPTLSAQDKIVVKPGDVVRARMKVRSSGAFPMQSSVQFFDAAGAWIVSNNSPSTPTTANGWAEIPETSGTAPANATWCIVQIGIYGTVPRALNDTIDLCQVLITINDVAGTTYFDGDFPPGNGFDYTWTGVANASTSQRWKGTGEIEIQGQRENVSIISASDILRDPVRLTQTTHEIITVVSVRWLDQTLDDEGKPSPTERITQVIDDTAIQTYGRRRLSITTDLIADADATELGNTLLARSRRTGWRADSYTWDTGKVRDDLDTIGNDDRQLALMDLLDGVLRIGKPLTLIDLPAWMPASILDSMYVEGGTYTYSNGAWILELTVSPAQGQGDSVEWNDLPSNTDWQWQDWNTEISWIDLYGVAGPTGV